MRYMMWVGSVGAICNVAVSLGSESAPIRIANYNANKSIVSQG